MITLSYIAKKILSLKENLAYARLCRCKNIKGFTIMEMLVSLSIFMIFVALSAGSYIGLMKANRIASDTQRVYRDIRHIFDTFSREAHNNQIDFTCFDRFSTTPDSACIENQQSEKPRIIAFISEEKLGTFRRLYKWENGTLKVLYQQRDISNTAWNAQGDWQSLTAQGTTFDEIYFTVFPLKNPYDSENVADTESQWQPSIGIVIRRGEIIYKTTYSSRSYGSKSFYKTSSPGYTPEILKSNREGVHPFIRQQFSF